MPSAMSVTATGLGEIMILRRAVSVAGSSAVSDALACANPLLRWSITCALSLSVRSLAMSSRGMSAGLAPNEFGMKLYPSIAASIRTSDTDRTPSIGRQVYLSCGNASARPTNLVRSVSRSFRNDAFTSAASSLLMTSCACAGAAARATSAASDNVASMRRNPINRLLAKCELTNGVCLDERSPAHGSVRRLPACRLPGGRAVLPLVVGQLAHVRAVVAHHEQLAVGLRRVGIDPLVLEPHARARPDDRFTVGGPRHVRVVAGREGQALHAAAVRLDRVDLVVPLVRAREHDQIAARRPQREIVVALGQRGDRFRLEIHDPQPFAVGSERSIDDAAAIGGHRGEAVVVGAAGDFVEAAAVGVDD